MFVLFKRLNIKQESIPVGCIPPTLVVTGVGEGKGVLPTRGVCCLLGGVLPTKGGVLPTRGCAA